MRLCMFHPNDNPMERGWVGRIDGDRVLHLAAQTLQSFFLGGAAPASTPSIALAEVTLARAGAVPADGAALRRATESFRFANATAVIGPGASVQGDGDR